MDPARADLVMGEASDAAGDVVSDVHTLEMNTPGEPKQSYAFAVSDGDLMS